MKKITLFILLLTGVVQSQIVNIPDVNFKTKLLQASATNNIAGSLKVDTNDNGEIEESEALQITMLNVNYSNISDLTGIQSFANLQNLHCAYNSLTTLNVSGMISLFDLTCNHNSLTSLNISNSTALTDIFCNNNQLTFIDLSDVSSTLFNLNCSNNLISYFNVPNPITILEMNCGNNQITYLDLSNIKLSSSLVTFYGNPIEIIVAKNNFIESSNFVSSFNGINTLKFICADDNEVTLINNQLAGSNFVNVVCNSYCTFTPGGNYNTITGNIKFDGDGNGCDSNDANFPNIRVDLNNGITAGASFANVTGDYKFYTQEGNFTITPSVENSTWFNFSPIDTTIPFVNNNNNTTTQNFCMTSVGVHPDVEVVPIISSMLMPGFDVGYKLVYKNKGNQVSNPTLSFSYDDVIFDFVSSSVEPTGNSNGTLTWSIQNLQPFESGYVLVILNLNGPMETPAVNIGDVVSVSSTIDLVNDENLVDNNFTLHQTVVGSFDPNDITCLEGGVVSPAEIGNYLHYNIRFENTGNTAAHNIVIKVDVNSTDYDVSSLQLINTSHPADVRITGNKVEYIFENIMLAPDGQGSVLLKIKSKLNLQIGENVVKKANIYFDYNFPIETNEAETVFQALNNASFEQDLTIKVYPNPAQSNFTISGNNNIKSIELYDIQGRLLLTEIVNALEATLDVSSRDKGIYFIKVISEKGIKVEKLIKE